MNLQRVSPSAKSRRWPGGSLRSVTSGRMPRATTRGAIAVRTTHLISPSPSENKMEIANLVLPVFGIGGSLSNPLGSLLVALARYTPHIWRPRRACWGCVGNCGIRHRRDEAALASQQWCRNFKRPWRDDLVDQRQHGLTGTQVSTGGASERLRNAPLAGSAERPLVVRRQRSDLLPGHRRCGSCSWCCPWHICRKAAVATCVARTAVLRVVRVGTRRHRTRGHRHYQGCDS